MIARIGLVAAVGAGVARRHQHAHAHCRRLPEGVVQRAEEALPRDGEGVAQVGRRLARIEDESLAQAEADAHHLRTVIRDDLAEDLREAGDVAAALVGDQVRLRRDGVDNLDVERRLAHLIGGAAPRPRPPRQSLAR